MIASSRKNFEDCEKAMKEILKRYIDDSHEKLLATLTNR